MSAHHPENPAVPESEFRQGTVVLVANTGWYLFNFRRGLLDRLRSAGHQVVLVCPADRYAQRLVAEGFQWQNWELDRRGMNPARELASIRQLAAIYRKQRPHLVHHFTIKCILYGTIAAKLAGVSSVVNSVTGLGHLFVSRRLTARLVRPPVKQLYRWALTSRGVIPMFQNLDDLSVLESAIPQLKRSAILTHGSGVDLKRYSRVQRPPTMTPLNVVYAGRLIREKGIEIFVEAAEQARELPLRFVAYGDPDPGNPSSISEQQLQRWQQTSNVEFRGHAEDIREAFQEADIVVLPSAREGFPRVLAEAAAMGLPVVATNVPGCRDAVCDGENGILIPDAQPAALLRAVELLARDSALRQAMGERSRQIAEERFDERHVVQATLNAYQQLAGIS